MSPQECRLECLRDEVICKDSMVWRRWPDPEIWCHDRRVQCEEECGQGTGEEKGPPPCPLRHLFSYPHPPEIFFFFCILIFFSKSRLGVWPPWACPGLETGDVEPRALENV